MMYTIIEYLMAIAFWIFIIVGGIVLARIVAKKNEIRKQKTNYEEIGYDLEMGRINAGSDVRMRRII